MGKGDKRSKRGKIRNGSYGNSRPKTKNLKKNTTNTEAKVETETETKAEE